MMNNLMIQAIHTEYTAEYIAKILWKQEIAKVNSITLIPQIKNNEFVNIAYITIASYLDTEAAYEFISKLKKNNFVELNYTLWTIQPNTHNDGNLCVGPYTNVFSNNFFKYDTYIYDYGNSNDTKLTLEELTV